MRIILSGCWHIGRKLAGYDWSAERTRAVEAIIERTHTADLFIHLGDLFDTGRPSPADYNLAFQVLDELDCPMFLLKGNHDENPGLEVDALEPLKKIRFRQQSKIVQFPCVMAVDGRVFSLAPYQNDTKARQPSLSTPGFDSAQAAVDDLLRRMKEKDMYSRFDGEGRAAALFCTHLEVAGLDYGVEESSRRIGAAYHLEDLVKLPFDVIVGHLHKAKMIRPNVYLPGSLLPFDFSEVGVQKYCITVEL